MNTTTSRPRTPTPNTFRAWLSDALLTLELRPAAVSRAVSSSPNVVGVFLREKDRDITLSLAAKIERYVLGVAVGQGATLHNAPSPKEAKPGLSDV